MGDDRRIPPAGGGAGFPGGAASGAGGGRGGSVHRPGHLGERPGGDDRKPLGFLRGTGLPAGSGRFTPGAGGQKGEVHHPLGDQVPARSWFLSLPEKEPCEQAPPLGPRHTGSGPVVGVAHGEQGNGAHRGRRFLPPLGHGPPAGPLRDAHRDGGRLHTPAVPVHLRQEAPGVAVRRGGGGVLRAGHRRRAFHRPGRAHGLRRNSLVLPPGRGHPSTVGLVHRLPAASGVSGPARRPGGSDVLRGRSVPDTAVPGLEGPFRQDGAFAALGRGGGHDGTGAPHRLALRGGLSRGGSVYGAEPSGHGRGDVFGGRGPGGPWKRFSGDGVPVVDGDAGGLLRAGDAFSRNSGMGRRGADHSAGEEKPWSGWKGGRATPRRIPRSRRRAWFPPGCRRPRPPGRRPGRPGFPGRSGS